MDVCRDKSNTPRIEIAPPTPSEPEPAEIAIEPPTDPGPAIRTTEPDSSSYLLELDPTDKAMLPDKPLLESPVAKTSDPDKPLLDAPVLITMSPEL